MRAWHRRANWQVTLHRSGISKPLALHKAEARLPLCIAWLYGNQRSQSTTVQTTVFIVHSEDASGTKKRRKLWIKWFAAQRNSFPRTFNTVRKNTYIWRSLLFKIFLNSKIWKLKVTLEIPCSRTIINQVACETIQS